jgi:sec-independent protein translocase protein TatB
MAFAFLFFDSVGGGEWLVLLAVVLIVVGPRNLPAAARKMGQILSQLRRAADEFKRQIMTMDQEMEKVVSDVKKDYIDVAEDVDKTVSEAASVGEGDGSDPELGDGGDRAYDYYGEDGYDETGESYSDDGPSMEEHPAEAQPDAAAETPSETSTDETTKGSDATAHQ